MEKSFFMTRREIASMMPCSIAFFDQHIRFTHDFKSIVTEKHLANKILFPRKQVNEYLESL